jgi:hypothetical protein
MALALTGTLPGCGGGGGGGNTPSTLPPAPAPVRTSLGTLSFTVLGTDNANRAGFVRDEVHGPLVINQAGALEIIADWTFASNDIDIILYSGTCNFQLLTTVGCTSVASATSSTQKPERLNVNINPGNYTVGITNFGRTDESGVVQVFLTR